MRTNRLSLEIADHRLTAEQALDRHAIACEIEETPQAEGTLLRAALRNQGSDPVHIAALLLEAVLKLPVSHGRERKRRGRGAFAAARRPVGG